MDHRILLQGHGPSNNSQANQLHMRMQAMHQLDTVATMALDPFLAHLLM
jgi:hypothetical protein